MRKLLYLILVLDVIGTIVGFFMTLSSSVLLAILVLVSGIIGLAPIYALISALDDIDMLKYDVSRLHSELYSIKKQEDEEETSKVAHSSPSVQNKEVSKRNWQCIKCVTVNKAGTSKCSNCGAPYDPYLNPTD